ncbi:MAG: hypothetical protein IT355_01200 [Gemmatimonadaceae bacterium]|nr:hypothetical protein [Gemmatimonadaceae bacterium]
MLEHGSPQRDGTLGWLLLARFPVALALASWHDTWAASVAIGGPSASAHAGSHE